MGFEALRLYILEKNICKIELNNNDMGNTHFIEELPF
jgi:hypothetical protein